MLPVSGEFVGDSIDRVRISEFQNSWDTPLDREILAVT
jgi:hypothetical protein